MVIRSVRSVSPNFCVKPNDDSRVDLEEEGHTHPHPGLSAALSRFYIQYNKAFNLLN